jgi:hypothetical protein
MEITDSPLWRIRDEIAGWIETDTGLTVHRDFTAGFAPPCVVLDGGGWSQLSGCQMSYQLRVNVIYGDQAGTSIPICEEYTRQVWDCLTQRNLFTETVPPPGVISLGDRDQVACQFVVSVPLDPKAS